MVTNHTTVDKLNTIRAELASELADALGNIIDKYTAQMVEIIRQTSIADLADLSETGPLTVRPVSSQSPTSRTESIPQLTDRIVKVLSSHPRGIRTHELRRMVSDSKEKFHQAIVLAMHEGKVKKSGVRRGTIYSLTTAAKQETKLQELKQETAA